ncbi:MAG: hypothetical protein WAM85_21400 [Terracidiphilus sp.]
MSQNRDMGHPARKQYVHVATEARNPFPRFTAHAFGDLGYAFVQSAQSGDVSFDHLLLIHCGHSSEIK